MKLQFLFVVFAALGRLGLSVETTPTVGIASHDGPEGKLKPKPKPKHEVKDHESSEPGKPSPNLRASSFGYGYDAGYGGGYNGRFGGRLRNFYNNNFGGGDDDGSDDYGRRKLEEEGDEGLSGFPAYDGPDGPLDGSSFDGSFDNFSPEDLFLSFHHPGFITFFDRLGRRFSRAVIYDSRHGAWLDDGPIFGGADQLPTTDGPGPTD
ncbi:hypothetical protein EBZ37_14670, partial [bacterium]|nr:hypothetical protein [bacterium]